MKRNENGYGTVVCLDKTLKKRKKPWAVRITVGWEDGKQKTKYLGYYATSKEAKLALAQFHLQGLNYDFNTVTFAQIFELWCEKKKDKLTEQNMKQYTLSFTHSKALHSTKFKDIKTANLQAVMDSFDSKRASKVKLKSLWNQMYEVAMENDLALKNYAEFVEINEKQEEVGSPFVEDEIHKLWELYGTNEVVDDILLLLYTGTRINEALAITKEAVHLEERYIEIHGTKTAAAERIVPIHEDIVPLIQSRLNSNHKYLFEKKGTKTAYRTFSYHFAKTLETLGIDHRVHDCRKTFVTNMYGAGVPMETIRFIVGHAQQGVTAEVYLKLKTNLPLLVESVNKMQLKV